MQCVYNMGSSKCLASSQPQLWAPGEEGTPSGCAISGPLEDQNVAVSWKQDKPLPPPALPLGPGSLILIKSLSCCFSSQKHVQ